MLTYLFRRLLLMIPTLLGITIVVFSVMALAPGGISAQSLVGGTDMNAQEKQALTEYYNKRYGLDQPAPIQYLRWLNNVSPIGFTFDNDGEMESFSFTKGMDLGDSFTYGRPVGEILSERIPITLLLNVVTIPLIYLLAIAIGVKAATDRGGSFDVSSSVIMLGLWSIPVMLAGVLLLGFFANVQHWQWFPTAGISSRAAQDMTFMPHWGSLWDVGKLFLGLIVGTGLAVWLSRWEERQLRAIVGTAFGLVAGVWMALAHAESLWLNWVLLPLSGAVVLGGLGWMLYAPFRITGLGLFGALLGALVAIEFMGDGYVRGFLADRLWHLVLPVICLSYGGFAALAKLTRTSVLENLNSDYARTARAKGLSEQEVLWKHVFRNSLLPLITVAAGLLPSLLGGSLIVENIFSINGMGQLAVEAVKSRDREMVLSIAWISGFLTLVGYLIADFLYTLVDPRVSYD
uniref:Oligopeptide transport system permease protein OppB (TC 3.A.1.5.1) n=1 Tax=uncultured Thiotrichaceae bacterium TaxID=298394 RepID=A0A6S6SAA2_9GAMM|nr:MAG: Oligopeptide transport system permease protein OppB (TC 3.A.1.5.1) [uncultured Thiotrichaceae bacterium]